MSRKRLLLFAATTGYQTRMFAEAAARLGVDTTLATDRCHILEDPWADQAVAVRFEHPEWSVKQLRGSFDAVAAVGDRPAQLAAMAAERLGLRFSPPRAVEACGNKALARQRFRAAGLHVPVHFRAALSDGAAAGARLAPYPCVLKPLGLSGSRGVIRADTAEQFGAAFARIRALLERPDVRPGAGRPDYLLVESYIPGREFALEGILSGGRLKTLALFDKPDPLEGPFFEETIYTTPSREDSALRRRIEETTARAAGALGLTDGPIHAEMRVNDAGIWMLEVAARPIGGLCGRCLRFTGVAAGEAPLEELIVRHALGGDVSRALLAGPAAGVMMIPIPRAGILAGTEGEDAARRVPAIEDVVITAKTGQELVPLPEGNSYLGFLFARAGSPAEVEEALRATHGRLRFNILESLNVL